MSLLQKIEEQEKCTLSKDSKTDLLIGTEKYRHKAYYFANYSDLVFAIKRFSKAHDH